MVGKNSHKLFHVSVTHSTFTAWYVLYAFKAFSKSWKPFYVCAALCTHMWRGEVGATVSSSEEFQARTNLGP